MRGMRLADARAQVPDLLSEIHEAEEDMKSLLGLCRWLERYSPWVAPEAPDGVFLDVTGVPHLFGGEHAMLAGMRDRLAHYGFTVRAAIAETIGAAWALARYSSSPRVSGERKGAHRDSDGIGEGRPDIVQSPGAPHLPVAEATGPFFSPFAGGEDKELGTLPIEALRIDGESARTLRRLGLKTVGALLDIPRASLARRFRGEVIGENVLMRLDEMMGHRDEPLNPLNPPSSFMAHRALMEPVISSEGLETVLMGLVTSLARDLEQQAKGATRLLLKLFRSDGSRVSLPAGFSAATHDPAHMLRVLKPKLEAIDAGFGIDAMTLEARQTAPARVQQYGFMEDDSTQALEQLNDRVVNRNEAGIVSLEQVESHVPERAEAPKVPTRHAAHDTLPVRGGGGKGKRLPSPSAGRVDAERPGGGRPLLIFERPEPATVIASVPDGPPMRFTWRRVTRRVVKSQGPERVAPEWWRLTQGDVPRDYYVIEDAQGRRYWLYREGLYGETGEVQPKWFVHGLSS